MHEIDSREPRRATETVTEPATFEEDDGNDEPNETEPRDRGQDEAEQKRRNRREGDHPRNQGRQRTRAQPRFGSNRDRAHVRRAQDQPADRGHDHEPFAVGHAGGEQREQRRPDTERERTPEPPAVEPDRLRDELPDGSFRRRQAL